LLGKAQYRVGNYAGAIQAFSTVLNSNVLDTATALICNYRLGCAFEKIGQHEQAQEAFTLMQKHRDGLPKLMRHTQLTQDLETKILHDEIADIGRRLSESDTLLFNPP
jgi:hypothetical protein